MEFSLLEGFEKLEAFLLEHPHISSDYATNFLTIEALNLAIGRKVKINFLLYKFILSFFFSTQQWIELRKIALLYNIC